MAVTDTRYETVLMDAGMFIGALLKGAPWHAEAWPVVEHARQGMVPACTTTGILSEVYGALTWEHAVPRHTSAEAAETERDLTNHDHPMKRLLFDRAHKPFAVRVHIRTPRGQYHWLHTMVTPGLVERLRKLGVPVMNEIALAQ
jgi:hypothetical protein